MFTAEQALNQHTKSVHKENGNTFKCRMCGKGCKSGSDLDSHIAQCARNALNPSFSQASKMQQKHTNNDTCRRGPGCSFLRAGNCHFFHPVGGQGRSKRWQEQERSQPCRRGPSCSFKAAGACNFFHTGVGVQQPRSFQGGRKDAQVSQGGRRQEGGRKQIACRYQEDCYKVPYCPFSHYDEDFPPRGENPRRR